MNGSAHTVMDPNFTVGHIGEFDYTFTDKELDDVLGFMERQQGRGPGEPYPSPPPALAPLLGPTAHLAPLQFQPHVATHQGYGLNQPLVQSGGYDYGMVNFGNMYGEADRSSPFIPPDPKLEMLESPRSGGAAPSSFAPPGAGQPYGRGQDAYGQGFGTQTGGRVVEGRTSRGTGSSNPAAAAPRRDGKPHVSHSTVEKQRRDRINSLIDELRDLVPPQGAEGAEPVGPASADQRRPKHVVLADTIQLVRGLQEKLQLSETRLEQQQRVSGSERLGAGSSSSANNNNGEAAGIGAEQSTDLQQLSANSQRSNDSHPELPQAPDDAAAIEEGVIVEEVPEEQTFHVKVHCKDRAGLLSDIVRALKQLPLEITSAAVTTTRHGMVSDVFQVKLERGETLETDAIRSAVEEVVFHYPGALGEKKRRAVACE